MDKKTILAVVVSMAILLVWQFFFSPTPKQVVPVAPPITSQGNMADNSSETKALENALAATPSGKLNEPVSVKTDLLDIRFDPDNGDIRSASILGWKDLEGDPITFNKGGGFNYLRLISPIAGGFIQEVKNVNNDTVVSYTAQAGDIVVTKEYTISHGSYLIKSNVKVTNLGNISVNVPLKVEIGGGLGDGFEESKYIFEGAVISNSKNTERVESDKTKTEEITDPLWAGYTSKYFLFASAAGGFTKATIAPGVVGEVASLDKSFIVNPGDRANTEFEIYIGPKAYKELKALGLGLQTSIDFGWFYFLAIPMLQIMIFLYGIFHNYGVAIIILTIIIKIITLPLTLKGMKSMKAMTKLQPKMLELKEKFKGDAQKLNIATMELYKEHKVNPMSGCLPLIIQIPIFFALYKALLLSIELKDAPFFGWLVDLSAKDPYYITPVIMGISMFIQQKMTPSTADPMQQKIFLAMPIIFTFLFLNFPSGLVVYWLTNNVLSIIQQYIVNKKSA